MPSGPRTRFFGRPRATSVTGDQGRLIGGKGGKRKAKKRKGREPRHRFIYWKASHAGVCSCGKWMLPGVNSEQGKAAWQEHARQQA